MALALPKLPSMREFLNGAMIVILVLVLFKLFPVVDITRYVPTIGRPRTGA